MGVTVISCPKLINLLAQILAFNLAVTRASIGKDIELKMSPGLSCGWARATPVKASHDKGGITEATDPCTVASAPMAELGKLLTGASWTGVSVSADAEADWSDTIKGVRDWITACEAAFAVLWNMVALGVTTDADVIVSVGVGRAVGAVDGTGAVRPRRTRGTSEPELRTTFLDRDGRGIVLSGKNIDKTEQTAAKARPEQILTSGSGLKSQVKIIQRIVTHTTYKQYGSMADNTTVSPRSAPYNAVKICCKNMPCCGVTEEGLCIHRQL